MFTLHVMVFRSFNEKVNDNITNKKRYTKEYKDICSPVLNEQRAWVDHHFSYTPNYIQQADGYSSLFSIFYRNKIILREISFKKGISTVAPGNTPKPVRTRPNIIKYGF